MYPDNIHIGTAFKGPKVTHINLLLTPTFYNRDIDGASSGYRTFFDNVERGSVVNKRSMLQKYTPEGYENRGLDLEFKVNVDKDIFVVKVIQVRGIFELSAFGLGILAGLAFIARCFKTCLGSVQYFKNKDQEYE